MTKPCFDIVSTDLYRNAANAVGFRGKLQPYLGHGKPLAITEFGSCTYRGAAGKGAMGWAVVDRTARPPALRAGLTRDEKEQADCLTDLLGIFAGAGVDTAFAFTFASYSYPYDPDPHRDLDLAAYGLVTCYRDRRGTSYPGMGTRAGVPRLRLLVGPRRPGSVTAKLASPPECRSKRTALGAAP
jgi:hypothetical protein